MERMTFLIDPQVHRELKILAAAHGKRIGDIIEGLYHLSTLGQFILDSRFKNLFEAMREEALTNAGIEGELVPEPATIKAEGQE
jgi:hypothetical protein